MSPGKVTCPVCDGTGRSPSRAGKCPFCRGAKEVSSGQARSRASRIAAEAAREARKRRPQKGDPH